MTKSDFLKVVSSMEEADLNKVLEPLQGMTANDFKAMLHKYGEDTIEERKRNAETERQIADPHTFDDIGARRARYNPNRQ